MSGVVAYVLNNAFNNDNSIQRSGSDTTHFEPVMICTKEPHPDMVEWFDSKC